MLVSVVGRLVHWRWMKRNVQAGEALRSASRWNMGMAVIQIGLAGASGNVGFLQESVHNLSDAVSFGCKGRATKSEDAQRARRLNKVAAGILLAGGIGAVAGATYEACTGQHEDASPIYLASAYAGAGINAGVAYRTRRSRLHEQAHGHAHQAHTHGKAHAMLDMGTGVLYTIGLSLETKYPGTASWVVMANGAITAGAGSIMYAEIQSETR